MKNRTSIRFHPRHYRIIKFALESIYEDSFDSSEFPQMVLDPDMADSMEFVSMKKCNGGAFINVTMSRVSDIVDGEPVTLSNILEGVAQ